MEPVSSFVCRCKRSNEKIDVCIYGILITSKRTVTSFFLILFAGPQVISITYQYPDFYILSKYCNISILYPNPILVLI